MGQARVDEGSKAYLCHAEHTEAHCIALIAILNVNLLEDWAGRLG